MPNAKDATGAAYQRILVAGRGAAGKTAQVWTLPGKKFAYLFDPAARNTLAGLDIEYEEFLPEAGDLDASLKGFNKGSKDDTLKGPNKARAPQIYVNWTEDFNKRVDDGFFNTIDWLIFDSYTLFQNAVMDRILWLNGRYGAIEELSDYRVSGSKVADISRYIFSLPTNIYATCHLNTYQDEKTKKLDTQINLSGKGRTLIPLLCNSIFELRSSTDEKTGHIMLTKPEPRGFSDIRTSLRGLKPIEDLEIKNWAQPEAYGIGNLLKKSGQLLLNSQKPKPAASLAPAVEVKDLPSAKDLAATPASPKTP